MNKVCLLIVVMLLATACMHQKLNLPEKEVNRLQFNEFKKAQVLEPVELKLKARLGQVEKTKFNSASVTEVFENGSLTNIREESVDFTAKAEIMKLVNTNEFIERLSTSQKDGQIDLHDFAMPEIGEELWVTYDSQAKILKAGNFPANSLYFVPPVSLPAEKQGVGATWTMEARWVTEQGVPLSLKLLSILKGFIVCGEKEVCADIELSGEVTLDAHEANSASLSDVNFESLWQGRLFFALERGSILWSLVESHEAWDADKVHREVRSCLESTLVEATTFKLWQDEKHKCQVPKLPKPTTVLLKAPNRLLSNNNIDRALAAL